MFVLGSKREYFYYRSKEHIYKSINRKIIDEIRKCSMQIWIQHTFLNILLLLKQIFGLSKRHIVSFLDVNIL